jgi:hypothetical protein
MSSSKMRSGIIVNVVSLALLALLTDVKRFLTLKRRVSGLYAHPNTLKRCVHNIPVSLKLTGPPERHDAVWTLQMSLRLAIRQSWDLPTLSLRTRKAGRYV